MGWIAKLLGRQRGVEEVRGERTPGAADLSRATGRDVVAESLRPATYAVIDVETTGLSPSVDRVIEIAIIRLDDDGQVVDEWVVRVDPEGPVGATHIHGITQSDVEGAPRFRDHARHIERMLGNVTIVGHNVRFDLGFVHQEMQRAGLTLQVQAAVCTLGESVERLPTLPRRRLADCCEAVGVAVVQAHSALGDARATAALFRAFLAEGPLLAQHIQSNPLARNRVGALPPAQRAHVQRRIEVHARQEARVELTRLINSVHLADVVDEGAEEGDLAYLEVLAEVLQDGVLDAAEQTTLADVAKLYSLHERRIAMAHRAFVVAMARLALLDLRLSREERAEIMRIAGVLAVDATDVSRVLNEAEISRWTLLSAGLRALPDDWAHGEPLRVGDKIAFTGCDEALRESLEGRATALGVRVINSVSARTALLVTDGTFRGTKADAAARFGTRTAPPAVLAVLLDHLQPYVAFDAAARREAVTGFETKTPVIARSESEIGTPSEIRAWAARTGRQVGTRGRIPADVVKAYASAHQAAEV